MKMQIELSEIEEFARNKMLFDAGKVINKDIMNMFMDITNKCTQYSFGKISITEESIIVDIDPKCFTEFFELLNKFLVLILPSVEYGMELGDMVIESMQLFNKKWGGK